MKKENLKRFGIAFFLLVGFVLWTLLVRCVDVKPIGPSGSVVGFAALNGAFRGLTGMKMTLYSITDWLGLVPVAFVFGFAILGLTQWIKRKKLCKVDFSVLVLGAFYIVTMAAYIFFEYVVINYRPVLIDGILEASYPSSTTMLVLCVIPTAIMQFRERIQQNVLRWCITVTLALFAAFMVIGRVLSGVHWLSDIIGGVLLSTGLVALYYATVKVREK